MAQRQIAASTFDINRRAKPGGLASAVIVVAIFAVIPTAQAQTFTVLYRFSGASGKNPDVGLSMDRAGNLYGTTVEGGFSGNGCAPNEGCGTVFELAHQGTGWILRPLYQFQGPPGDGAAPVSRVIFGPDGALYGATVNGGPPGLNCARGLYLPGCGIVFKLTPPASICKSFECNWSETQLYAFSYADGSGPMGELAFDAGGNLYGATMSGGAKNAGTAFELTPASGDWTLTTLQTFTGADGSSPMNGVKLDSAGNVYGTTYQGTGNGEGTVFELTRSQTGWSLNTLYAFPFDSAPPRAGVILDQAGNLYGSTCRGAVFELSPFNGNWAYDTVYNLSGSCSFADLTMDAVGNLYGTTYNGGSYGFGSVFRLTPSDDGWTYSDLYDFLGGSDGGQPLSNVLMDANGNLYGTASTGGSDNGVVWEITP